MALAKILFGGGFTILACYSLGRLFLWRIPAPRVMALPVGAAILSLCIYVLLLLGAADRTVLLAIGICALLPLLWRDKRPAPAQPHEPLDPITRWLLIGVFTAYGVLYAVHTLAPEIQPDALYYHLGLVSEYNRLGAFPTRIDFYDILPQGMEMLYLLAFSLGAHSAAKLVHFAFLIATVPVMLAIGRRLGIGARISWIAAALYFCAPVVGISGTCAYTDAALVCSTLAAFYFLLAWKQEGQARYLVPAGLLAGFCYAIKVSAILVPALAGLFVLFECRRSWRLALARGATVAAAALATIAPWMIRSFALTGNPLAPLLNAWFPNPYFLLVIERGLDQFFHTYNGFTYRNAAWELTVGGASHGIVGPVFLLLPLGLLALRRPAGRWLWIAGALLALPWLTNAGTRFLMPSLPFFALALVLALPRRAAWILLLVHAVVCWPAALDHYERPGLWRLRGFPWRVALRLDSERDYLSTLSDYKVAEMINAHTRPDSRILALTSLADAYIDREIYQHWQSELATRLREQILEAAYTAPLPLYEWSAEWHPQLLRAVRWRTQSASGYEWEIHEASVFSNGDRLRPGVDWQASGWPNLFETPFALDGSQATRWRSWEPARPGMFFQVDFDTPQSVSGVAISGHWEIPGTEVFGMDAGGRWRLLSDRMISQALPKENLRLASMRQVRRAGIGYIVTPVAGGSGGEWLGKDLQDHAAEYGLTEAGKFDIMRLYKVDGASHIPILGP
jgi:hypothetical protein